MSAVQFQSAAFILMLKSFKVTFNFTLLGIFSLLINRPDFLMGEGVPKQTKIRRGEPRGRKKRDLLYHHVNSCISLLREGKDSDSWCVCVGWVGVRVGGGRWGRNGCGALTKGTGQKRKESVDWKFHRLFCLENKLEQYNKDDLWVKKKTINNCLFFFFFFPLLSLDIMKHQDRSK